MSTHAGGYEQLVAKDANLEPLLTWSVLQTQADTIVQDEWLSSDRSIEGRVMRDATWESPELQRKFILQRFQESDGNYYRLYLGQGWAIAKDNFYDFSSNSSHFLSYHDPTVDDSELELDTFEDFYKQQLFIYLKSAPLSPFRLDLTDSQTFSTIATYLAAEDGRTIKFSLAHTNEAPHTESKERKVLRAYLRSKYNLSPWLTNVAIDIGRSAVQQRLAEQPRGQHGPA